MEAAAGIERGGTSRARRGAIEIVTDGQFVAACPAQNRFFVELLFRPDGCIVAAGCLMAFIARKIVSAAMEADGDPVNFRMVMPAAGFMVDIETDNGRALTHRQTLLTNWRISSMLLLNGAGGE